MASLGRGLVLIGRDTISDRRRFADWLAAHEYHVLTPPPAYLGAPHTPRMPSVRVFSPAGELP